jgi:hypothetical protein
MPSGQHDASASAVGYQYQTSWCLLELLRRGPQRPDDAISLEMHDDVAWENSGTPLELLQTKHHLGATAGLGDKDADMWKTLLVWMNTGNPTDPQGPTLALVTTSVATSGTAAHALRETSRNTAAALDLLTNAAATSSAKATEKARARFLALSPAERQVLVSLITVVDASPTVDDIDAAVRAVLWHTLPDGHEDLFLAQLWRWWAGVALDMLRGRRAAVDAVEARAFISSLRNRFSDDDLPTLVELSDLDEDSVVAAHESSPFVHQMRWVEYNQVNLRKAIVDYHRAVTQTVKWSPKTSSDYTSCKGSRTTSAMNGRGSSPTWLKTSVRTPTKRRRFRWVSNCSGSCGSRPRSTSARATTIPSSPAASARNSPTGVTSVGTRTSRHDSRRC